MWVGTRRQFNGIIIGGLAMYITENFTTNEMACSCCNKSEMNEEFMRILQSVRDEMQRPLKITSGY